MQRIVPEPVKGFMIGREQANYVLNEAFLVCDASHRAPKKPKYRA
jgi:hypothetical protein